MNGIKNFRAIGLVLVFGMFASCQPLLRLATGVNAKLEYTLNNTERLKYYKPYFEADNASVYTLANSEEFCKNINYFGSQVSTVYFEDTEQRHYYTMSCFDDIRSAYEDLNNEDFSFLTPISEEVFFPIKDYITNTSLRVFNQEQVEKHKRWNVYIITGTFMGKKLRKRTAMLTEIKDLNYLYLLDLSVDTTNMVIDDEEFSSIECAKQMQQKVTSLR